jgi:antitoxin (DNA-binding transcriptional repressor) of toxin-antitoxin stability system
MPRMTTISATDAARSFAAVLTRVARKGEEFIVERGGEPVCRISPVGPVTRSSAADLARVLADCSPPDPAYFRLLQELGAKQDESPLGDPWER